MVIDIRADLLRRQLAEVTGEPKGPQRTGAHAPRRTGVAYFGWDDCPFVCCLAFLFAS